MSAESESSLYARFLAVYVQIECFVRDSASFLKEIETTAKKTKRNDVVLVAVVKD